MTEGRRYAGIIPRRGLNCQRDADMSIKIEETDESGKTTFSTYTDTWERAIDITIHRFVNEAKRKPK